MQIIYPHPAGPCSTRQVKKFEAEIGSQLPERYKNWLSQVNGGEPNPKSMPFVENGIPTSSDVDWLYGLGEPDWADLSDAFITFKKRIPAKSIPVARDSGGNQYIMNLITGRVYFWNHEEESRSYADLPVCADSFERFLLKLRMRED